MIEDARENEIRELNKTLSVLESSSVDVENIYKKYLSKVSSAKILKAKIDILKSTVKNHFDQMQADSEYLKRLDLIKPKYFKTLEKYNKQLHSVNETINKHIIESQDKKIMLQIISEANEYTQNTTGKLSKAFLEHYERYKNILNRDTKTYYDNLNEFNKESESYENEEKTLVTYQKEYNRAIEILERLKSTYSESRLEAQEFDSVIQIVELIFKDPKKIKTFFDGPVDGKCATTLLRTHIKNDLL